MRILNIRLQNLNALVGNWEIDLTAPAYRNNGLFAITGPTGSGKSTILDAICLALYGRTPRLARIGKNGNEIMARKTGTCYAEVTIATDNGQYRCHWSQHRAHKKADGELQNPKHEIADTHSGKLLATSLKDVATHIEKLTGMDYARFTRAMLLAQGDFAAFLQAAPDERAPLLEQITGTDIYSRISIRVHEQQREAREILQRLQIESAGIQRLSATEKDDITQRLTIQQQQAAALATQRDKTQQKLQWQQNLEALQRDIMALTDESQQLQQDIAAFQPMQQKLERARHAALLDGDYAALQATREQQKRNQAALTEAETALPIHIAAVTTHQAQYQTAVVKSEHYQTTIRTARPRWQHIRQLDQQRQEQQQRLTEAEADCAQERSEIEKHQQKQKTYQQQYDIAHATLTAANAYCHEHAADAWLISGLTGLTEQLHDLQQRQQALKTQEKDIQRLKKQSTEAEQTLQHCRQQNAQNQQRQQQATTQYIQAKQTLEQHLAGRQLREYRSEQKALQREITYLRTIASLEAQRVHLTDGTPCPLCGATSHPFAHENIPHPDSAQQQLDALDAYITQAEALERTLDKQNAAQEQAYAACIAAQEAEHLAQSAQQRILETLENAQKQHTEQQNQLDTRRTSLTEQLALLAIKSLPDDIATLQKNLQQRLHDWQTHSAQNESERRCADIHSEIQQLNAIIHTRQQTLDNKTQQYVTLRTNCQAIQQERQTQYGDENPDDAEQRLQEALHQAEKVAQAAQKSLLLAEQQQKTTENTLTNLRQQIAAQQLQQQTQENAFATRLTDAGFNGETTYLAARLPASEQSALTAQADTLIQRRTTLQAKQQERESRLITERGKNLSTENTDTLKQRLQEETTSLEALQANIAADKYKLNEDARAESQHREKQKALDTQTNLYRRWQTLHELIGSADGKKYRNFAQSLTFASVIAHANRQLAQMNDRYLLTRASSHPLEINVIDNYQAGEIRSAKNLSGGESFIVSLALALGLSQMAGDNIRVESLFLDEGFGTLDEETLDSALETLTHLQASGKLIGVISHIPALTERIPTRIQLTPHGDGRSSLSGPGLYKTRSKKTTQNNTK
ncbi:MAG: AAA family ATPase [Cardiobacteriaceae bacterium]|nr:AAA family ATPase [Cardiobacteriaceae bacterium]